MTGSVHAAVGALVGRYIKNKPLAFGAGVLSHLIGDIVPHQDMGIGETPIVFGTLARIGLHHGWNSSQFWGALGGVCPDFEHIPYELRKDPRRHEAMDEKWFPTHNNQIKHGGWPLHFNWGVLMQVVLFLGCLYAAGTLGRTNETHDS